MKDFVIKEEASYRCSCAGPHYVTLTRWSDDENYTYMDIGGNFRSGSRFLGRVKMAWEVLWHGHASDWIELVIDDPAKADEIVAFLSRGAEALRKPAAGE